MACTFAIFLAPGRRVGDEMWALESLDLIDWLEAHMTIYRDDSQIARVNRGAAHQPTMVDSWLFELLQTAVRISADTQGAFDVTSGALSRIWGFSRRAGRFPTDEERRRGLECSGFSQLLLNTADQTIRFARAGMELNLGAIGKGYAIDRVGMQLREQGVEHYLVHAGYSSVRAAGDRDVAEAPESPPRTGWRIGLRHPLRPERRIAELVLIDQALATSGSDSQFFYHRGRRYGHILDPRSGLPASGVLSATVLAADATQADALATAFYVLGVEATAEYCRQHSDVGALLITAGTQAGTVDMQAMNVPADRWQRLED